MLLQRQRRLFGRKRALTRREKRRVIAGIAGAVVVAFGVVTGCQSAGIWINTTDSMPMGLWRQTPLQAAKPGDVVLLCLPATAGDRTGPGARLYRAQGLAPPARKSC